jgi:peptide/nickel transport system substrate-binding protein
MSKPCAQSSQLAFLSLLIVTAVSVVSCAPAGNSSKVLIYGATGDPINLEPGNVTDGNSLVVQIQLYERLLDFKPGTAELQPALATA